MAFSVSIDYYAVLGVPQTADETLIKSRYKILAKLKHPDKNLDNPQATADFQLLVQAYSILSNPTDRHNYDTRDYPRIRRRQTNPPHSPSSPSPSPPPPTTPNTNDDPTRTLAELTTRHRTLDATLFTLRTRHTNIAQLLADTNAAISALTVALAELRAQAAAQEEQQTQDGSKQGSALPDGLWLQTVLCAMDLEGKTVRAAGYRAEVDEVWGEIGSVKEEKKVVEALMVDELIMEISRREKGGW